MTGLVRAELLKITSTRLWWGLLIGAVAFSGIQSLATALVAGMEAGAGAPAMPGLETPEAVRSVYPMAMFTGTYMFALVLGITGMTGEYRHQTITSTFLVAPRRARVVVAKILAHALMGVVFGLVGLLTVLVVGGATMSVRGYGLGLDADRLWVTNALAVLAVAIWAVLGIGVGTLVRNQVAAIVAALLFTFLVEPLVTFAVTSIEGLDLDWLVKWLPSNASSALMAPGDVMLRYLDWWAGGLVLLAYGLVLAALGVVVSVRRDVS
ncbi:MAG TPA: ABC transporter permease [Nocardioidaceae bacterium]|nr:ABC transporter permease [Nocardioidaceae bacterium]